MQHTTRARTLSLALALAALAAPAPAALAQAAYAPAPTARAERAEHAAAAAWVGVYRVDMTKGTETIPVRVIMERVGDSLDGTILVGGTASALGSVRAEGTELRAAVTTSAGRGELVLRTTPAGLTGTLTIGRAVWSLTGSRSV
jgi:hypothetical protein